MNDQLGDEVEQQASLGASYGLETWQVWIAALAPLAGVLVFLLVWWFL